MTIESDIKQKALALGFDAVGITTAEPLAPDMVEFYQQWLADGRAAKMDYLHRNNDKRFAPAELLTGARSVICVALNYRPECSRSVPLRNGSDASHCIPKSKLEACPTLRIARFAQYEDYHPFIKERLFQLADFIGNAGVSPAMVTPASSGRFVNRCDRDGRVPKFKACVDSAPLAERALAQRAGLGFIGKNHMLIHPELGGQILLGELLTTLELTPDAPLENQSCGSCGKCIRACPTGALAADGSFDARKCLSYLTIEEPAFENSPSAKGQKLSPCQGGVLRRREGVEGSAGFGKNHPGLRPPLLQKEGSLRGYIFGCDECLLACPYEMNAPVRENTDFRHHPEWQELTPEQIHSMTEEQFQTTFAHSGFIRLGLERLKRNCSC